MNTSTVLDHGDRLPHASCFVNSLELILQRLVLGDQLGEPRYEWVDPVALNVLMVHAGNSEDESELSEVVSLLFIVSESSFEKLFMDVNFSGEDLLAFIKSKRIK